MKSPREVLKKLYESAFENSVKSSYIMEQNPYGIDTALSDLSEIVMAQKKEKRVGGVVYAFTETWNGACDHIAKLFLDKEEK